MNHRWAQGRNSYGLAEEPIRPGDSTPPWNCAPFNL
jgi:hypothetical protein